jgi:hypothetical protein
VRPPELEERNMFRESDYLPPVLHPSYANKPVSEFQARSQMAPFEDPRPVYVPPEEDAAEVIPVTYDTKYDPSHPDADWGVR